MLLQRSGFKETLKYRPFGFSNETFSTTSLNTLLVLAVAVSCSSCALVALLTWQLYMLVNTITSHLSCTQNFLFSLTEIYYQHTRLSNDRYSGLSVLILLTFEDSSLMLLTLQFPNVCHMINPVQLLSFSW